MHRSLGLRALLRALWVRPPSSSRKQRRFPQYLPHLETLEDRITPSTNLSVSVANNPIVYNSGGETLDLKANVSSSTAGTINEGQVIFTVNGVSSGSVTVSNGLATDSLTLPAASVLMAGNYPNGVSASYTDAPTDNYAPANATGDVAVSAAATATRITSTLVNTVYNSTTPPTVTLTAAVTSSNGGTVNEGNVTFLVANPTGADLTALGSVTKGTATVALTVPAGFAAGNYSFTASYADVPNSNGSDNYAASTVTPPGSASFVNLDATTQGNWQGVYGSEGYTVIGNASSYPSYAQVIPSGNSTWAWASSTSDPRALQDVGGSDRIAACWYAGTSAGQGFTINVNLTDGQTHQLALYLLDWDRWDGGRSEQVQILDAKTGNVLSTQNVSNFGNGEYLVWNVSGDLEIKLTSEDSFGSAVVSGLFLDPSTAPPPSPLGTLNVQAAATATVPASNAGITYNSMTSQTVTLTATVTSATGGSINEGNVTFTVINPNGSNLTASASVTNGIATTNLTIPSGFAPGSYTLTASYADPSNVNDAVNYAASSGAATLSVSPVPAPPPPSAAPTTIVREIVVVPVGDFAVEIAVAQVSSSTGPVDGSIVTINLDGAVLHAAVSGGQVAAFQLISLPLIAEPQTVSVSLSGPTQNYAVNGAAELVLMALLNNDHFGYVLFGTDGSQTVATVINGISVGLEYNAQGQFIGIVFGLLPVPI